MKIEKKKKKKPLKLVSSAFHRNFLYCGTEISAVKPQYRNFCASQYRKFL